MMEVDRTEVERIVRRVFAEMHAAGGGAPPVGEAVIAEHVVSEALLSERLGSAGAVVVSARAVVTPAARDFLRERGIALRVEADAAGKTTGVGSLVVGGMERADVEGLGAAMEREGFSCGLVVEGSLGAVAAEVADGCVREGVPGAVVVGTKDVAAAVCLLNRRAGVRAAVVKGRGCVRSLRSGVGMNVMVLDRERAAWPAMLAAMRTMAAAGAGACPAEYRTWLS